jgi:hypothetical protein
MYFAWRILVPESRFQVDFSSFGRRLQTGKASTLNGALGIPPVIVRSESICPAWSDEDAQNFYKWKLFIIRGSLYCLHLLLEPALPKPEIPCSILLDRYTSKSLAGIQKKLVFVSHLSPFEFFFHCRKQVEVIGGYIRWIAWLWHAAHVMFFKPISWSPAFVNWTIVNMNHKSFLIRRPSSRKDCLFEWSKYVCNKVGAVHLVSFGSLSTT